MRKLFMILFSVLFLTLLAAPMFAAPSPAPSPSPQLNPGPGVPTYEPEPDGTGTNYYVCGAVGRWGQKCQTCGQNARMQNICVSVTFQASCSCDNTCKVNGLCMYKER